MYKLDTYKEFGTRLDRQAQISNGDAHLQIQSRIHWKNINSFTLATVKISNDLCY